MLDNATIMLFGLYAAVALSIAMFTFGYVFLYWARRQTPERRARVIERMRRFSDQSLQVLVRFWIWWAVVSSVLLLVTVIVVSILDTR